MFPYPSGDKLHIGHWYNYGPVDTWGRYMKMKGYEVFQPMGFDAFGLPAENHAIKQAYPAETTAKHRQNEGANGAIGGMYDLVEFETSAPEYYKWTQWIFAVVQKASRIAGSGRELRPSCQTVPRMNKSMPDSVNAVKVGLQKIKQWFFKITDYSNNSGLRRADWPKDHRHAAALDRS
jgi:leucyl-tRNA synthetase